MPRYTLTRDFYVPKAESVLNLVQVDNQETDAEIWTYEVESIGGQIRFYAVGFHGRAQKPDFNNRYANEAARDDSIQAYIKGRKQTLQYKKDRLAARKAASAQGVDVKVGDVFVNSWGYDQTNVDAFQVVERKGKLTVVMQKIGLEDIEGSDGFMSKIVKPVKDAFVEGEEPITRRVNPETKSIKMHSWGSWANLWDGNSTFYNSWYA